VGSDENDILIWGLVVVVLGIWI